MTDEYKVAHETQEKFQFYALALIFTLLAAAIQSASLQRSKLEIVFELLGWVGLLVAGVSGLWKVEWAAPIRIQMQRREELQKRTDELKQLQLQGTEQVFVHETGQMQHINDRIRSYLETIRTIDGQCAKLEKADAVKYSVAKYAFVFGLLALMASRSVAAAAGLFGYHLL